MKRIFYDVHSDVDENNLYASFDGKGSKQRAIAYAKEHKVDETWVEKVIFDDVLEEYEYLDSVWAYTDEE